MVNKTVTVVSVETKKAGKTDRIVLNYVSPDGNQTWSIGGLAAKLDDTSRKALKAAKQGDVLQVEVAKVGDYWNLISAGGGSAVQAATKASDKPAYTPSSNSSSAKSPDTNIRIQTMNALTNAVASLGTGKTSKEYKERVVEFMLVVDDVIEAATAGTLKALKSGANNDDAHASVEEPAQDW